MKEQQYISIRSIGKSRKHSVDTEIFEMKMIADQFEDGWQKYIIGLCVEQRIEALFKDR